MTGGSYHAEFLDGIDAQPPVEALRTQNIHRAANANASVRLCGTLWLPPLSFYRLGYSAPTTLKSWLTKTWCGQLTPM
jgi:hypothetical protein